MSTAVTYNMWSEKVAGVEYKLLTHDIYGIVIERKSYSKRHAGGYYTQRISVTSRLCAEWVKVHDLHLETK